MLKFRFDIMISYPTSSIENKMEEIKNIYFFKSEEKVSFSEYGFWWTKKNKAAVTKIKGKILNNKHNNDISAFKT